MNREFGEVKGILEIAGRQVELSRVIAQSAVAFPTEKGPVFAHVFELEDHSAFIDVNGNWIEGKTHQKRWLSGNGYDERVTIFTSTAGDLELEIRSSRVTV